ncbi:DUF4421 family protein [Winogradskyella sediminis]|uniref:Uncharacterized protein n=1 Tax=Winogradskyella sediminis TaxID=1382466 RepID=A0A1H1N0N0_9FLAO|nr:DUF4421 family protein [Winogradskyella sediminis]SDR92522.1 protein of unknown function [Winogradskyella sediminis]
MRKPFLLFICCLGCISLYGQDLDSLLVDRDDRNYSLRIFSNFKVNKFNITDSDSKTKFVPNNRYGLGAGFANKKIIIDIAINIKNPNKEKTSRFDLQGTTILKNKNYVKIFTQVYKGFNVKNDFDEPTVFRGDIRSVSVGLNYLYTFSDIEFSYSVLKAGLANKNYDNVFITGGIGAFGSFDYFSGNPSILSETTSPYYNEQADVKRYKGLSFGVLAGFISFFKLSNNISATLNVMPGIGLVDKRVQLQDDSFKPSDPMLYKLDFLVGLSYNLNRYYVSLTYNNGIYSTNLDYGNNYLLNLTKAKLAVGYKFGNRK